MRINLAKTSGRPAIPGKELKFIGSNERVVGRSGDLNGWDKKDLLRTIAHLMNSTASGDVDTSDRHEAVASVKDKREVLIAAYEDKHGNDWQTLGTDIASSIQEAIDRQGFMRRLMFRSNLEMGNVPRVRVVRKLVTAVIMSSEGHVFPQFVRDNYLFPPEFTISANVRVEQREINQGSGDIMQEKYDEGQEAIMVKEDLVWKRLADSTANVFHAMRYISGNLSPTSLAEMKTTLEVNSVVPANVVMAGDFWNDIIAHSNFQNWFDPVSKYEIVTTGRLGEMLGLTFITDGFRLPTQKVLNPGDFYIVGDPQQHGTYTDRGPLQSNEVNQYPDGSPARGWYMFEELSAVIGNVASVIVARRA
jgi:hypothetical protein